MGISWFLWVWLEQNRDTLLLLMLDCEYKRVEDRLIDSVVDRKPSDSIPGCKYLTAVWFVRYDPSQNYYNNIHGYSNSYGDIALNLKDQEFYQKRLRNYPYFNLWSSTFTIIFSFHLYISPIYNITILPSIHLIKYNPIYRIIPHRLISTSSSSSFCADFLLFALFKIE